MVLTGLWFPWAIWSKHRECPFAAWNRLIWLVALVPFWLIYLSFRVWGDV